MVRNISINCDNEVGQYQTPPIDNLDDEYFESVTSLFDFNSLCLEEKFISGNQSDFECYGDGDPIIIVPDNWPPRDWDGPSPRRAVIYLDDLICMFGDIVELMDDPVLGNRIDPLTEIQNILTRFSYDIQSIIILGSYWAAHEIFDMINKEGNKPSRRVAKFIDQLRVSCAFKFVITRGERHIRNSSASRFICY